MQRVIKKYILNIATFMFYRIYNLKYVIFRLKNQILFLKMQHAPFCLY